MKKSILPILFILILFSCERIIPKKQCWECYTKLTDLKGGNAVSSTDKYCDATSDEIDKIQRESYAKTPANLILNIKCEPKN